MSQLNPGQQSAAEQGDGPCWCGESDAYFDDALYDRTCGGRGTLYCYCGGDQCACHNHGEVDCPGCDDCDDVEDDDDYEVVG